MFLHTSVLYSYKIFTSADEAESMAATLNADEADPWTYVVSHDPQGTGKAFIRIFDEDGIEIGNL